VLGLQGKMPRVTSGRTENSSMGLLPVKRQPRPNSLKKKEWAWEAYRFLRPTSKEGGFRVKQKGVPVPNKRSCGVLSARSSLPKKNNGLEKKTLEPPYDKTRYLKRNWVESEWIKADLTRREFLSK